MSRGARPPRPVPPGTDPATGCAGLLLAAGAGSRFGADKAALALAGTSFGDRALGALRGGGCDPLLVVVAPGRWRPTVSVQVVPNPDPSRGLSSSLRVGLQHIGPGTDAVVVTLADTPLVVAEHVRRLLRAWSGGARLAVASYSGARRTPVLLGREHWAGAAEAASGETGARAYLELATGDVLDVDCTDLGRWQDVDTPADLARLRLR